MHWGDGGGGQGLVLVVNERDDFLHKKFRVAVGAPAAEARRFGGRVFVDARFPEVVNSDDDERLHGGAENEVVGGLADVPVHAGNEGGGAVEKILAIVQVKNREAPPRLLAIAGRKIHDEVALVAQEARAELFMLVEVGRHHGRRITSRSLASTCWPG